VQSCPTSCLPTPALFSGQKPSEKVSAGCQLRQRTTTRCRSPHRRINLHCREYIVHCDMQDRRWHRKRSEVHRAAACLSFLSMLSNVSVSGVKVSERERERERERGSVRPTCCVAGHQALQLYLSISLHCSIFGCRPRKDYVSCCHSLTVLGY